MAREIKERSVQQEGNILLVSDPHEGSGKERWFVECQLQLRFGNAGDAWDFYQRLMSMTTPKTIP